MHPKRIAELPARVASKIEVDENGCWIWTAARYGSGYGATTLRSRCMHAHRAVYMLLVGPIPEGLDLDHLCRVRACVNPAHLEPVSRRENLLRGETIPAAHARKTHCPKGHEYTPENTEVRYGSRFCKQCRRELGVTRYYQNDGAGDRRRYRLAQWEREVATGLRKPHRPRGGDIWSRLADGVEVAVRARKHGFVLWRGSDDTSGVAHENDFGQDHAFIRGITLGRRKR